MPSIARSVPSSSIQTKVDHICINLTIARQKEAVRNQLASYSLAPGMVFRQAGNILSSRKETHGRNDTDLAHAPTTPFASSFGQANKFSIYAMVSICAMATDK
jgi:hypothetical protein